MYRIICPECNNKNDFDKPSLKPLECSFCFHVFAEDCAIEKTDKTLSGLKLVYQQTDEEITIMSDEAVLGREYEGAVLFKAIQSGGKPVISRRHCSLSLHNGVYYLKDENSNNGTFAGIDKQECLSEARPIYNGDILFLGREPFLVQYIYDETSATEVKPENEVPKAQAIRKYRCNQGCGFETESYTEICPKCYTCNSLVEVLRFE